jgi:hypothetical protein
MEYSFKKIENNGSYKLDISNLNTEIIIIGKTVSGAKINVYYENIIPKEFHKLKKYFQIYNDEENQIINIGNSKKNSKTKLVKIILNLPENINLEIKNCMDKVSIDNISGTIQINNQSGIIDINNMKGNLNIIASESEIKIQNSKVHSKIDMKGFDLILTDIVGSSNIFSIGGDVFIEKHEGDLLIFTNGGNLSVKNLYGEFSNFKSSGELILIEDAQTNMSISNQLGNIDLKNIRGFIKGKTENGNISINNYYGNLRIDTNSGDISLVDIIGSTDISSNLGNVNCKLNYEPSFDNSYHSIQTIEGNIKLTIPKGLSMSITSKIGLNRTTQDITSEIPLNFSVRGNKIIGEAFINYGSVPILLYTENGYIIIKSY